MPQLYLYPNSQLGQQRGFRADVCEHGIIALFRYWPRPADIERLFTGSNSCFGATFEMQSRTPL